MKKKLIYGVIAVLFLCVAVSLATRKDEDEAAPVAATATSAPAVALPTNTPQPKAPTATPGVSAEEAAYALEVAKITANYADSFKKIGALMTEASEKTWLLLDDEWKLEVVVCLVIWQLCGESIRDLEAPPRLQDIHQDLVQAARHIDRSSTLLSEGIDEINADKFNESTKEMLLGNEYINQATAKMNAFQ